MSRLPFILILSFLITILSSCHVARYFYRNVADVRDYKKFPSVPVNTGAEKTILPERKPYIIPDLPRSFKSEKTVTLQEFVRKNKTNVFLIIRNDTIIYKQYCNGYSDSSVCPSFSVSKAFISALTGIAISEGKISGTEEQIGKYFPEFSGKDIGRVTVGNLLNMRSGIGFKESYSTPFSSMAKYYYGRNLQKYIRNLGLKSEPDSAYDYISVNTLLLGLVLERATGMKLNDYLEEKVWKPAGMNYPATWSIDSRKHKTIKSFCCLNARPVDFALFGTLYLHRGYMNRKQVVPGEWVESSTVIVNNSIDSQGYPYTNKWRVLPDGSFFAKGALGQYIYVYPPKKLVFVRLGKSYAGINWVEVFRMMAKQL